MKFKKLTFCIFLLLIILLNLTIIYGTNITKNNIKNYFRMHIVSNSDSIDDQLLKYQVARKVSDYIDTITKNSLSKEESKHIIINNIQEILKVADDVLKQNNSDYPIKALVGNIRYDTKTKDHTTMEAGIYDSLQIIIGDGCGQNFWSLIFPSSISSNLQDTFNEDIQYSFKFLELFKDLIEKMSEN